MELKGLKDFIENLNDNQKEDLKKLIDEQKEEFMCIIDEYKKDKKIKTGYEKPEKDDDYWLIPERKEIDWSDYLIWKDDKIDMQYYENANCYTIREVAEADARADLLMRKLRRFAKLNNKEKIDWKNSNQDKYCLECNYGSIEIGEYRAFPSLGNIYFTERSTAREALEKFEDELEWYFKEYLQKW